MKPVRGVQRAEALAFIRSRYGDEVTDLVPVDRQGLWSSAFRFRDGDREFVVRFSNVRENFERDAFAARQASAALPIPPVLDIGEAPAGYFALSTYVPGHLLDEVDGPEMRSTLPSLLAVLDAVRAVDLSTTTGFGYWDANGHGADETWEYVLLGGVHRWRATIAASPVGLMSFEAGVARIKELLPFSPPLRHLVHSDLLHHNVLVNGGRVTALLDWGSGFIGDFMYDIAWLTFWQPWYPKWDGIDFAATARAHYAATGLVVKDFAERLRCYELRIALSNQEWFAERGDHANLEKVAARTLALADAALGARV